MEPLSLAILLPFLFAVPAPAVARRLGRHAGWLLTLAPALVFLSTLRLLPFAPGHVLTAVYPWAAAHGLELAFLMDGLSATFVLLISGIGALVVIYAGGYLGDDPRLGRFYLILMAFMGSMLGLVLADNLITLFVFWELTSVTSYLLIGFDHQRASARDAAYRALLVTGIGGLLLLAGFLLMSLAGTQAGLSVAAATRISELAAVDLRSHALYPAMAILVILGCLTKSAQVPFHFWLPGAMAGPTPVSSYLHSATMVKAGVYLLARLSPQLGGTDLWVWILAPVGLATMLLGALTTLLHRDLKSILAYSTLAVLGTLVMLLGIGTELAVKTALVYLVAHAMYKAALFMVAGNVDHETGTRDLARLGGLGKLMPWTALAGILAALSKAGAPPMFGFIGKELLYKTKLDLDTIGAWAVVGSVVANVALVASAFMVSIWPFLGRHRETPRPAHEAPRAMLIGAVTLALLGLGRGLMPEPFEKGLGSGAATAILGRPMEMKLKLWHGVDPAALTVLALSVVTLLAGWLVYRAMRRTPGGLHAPSWLARLSAERVFDALVTGSQTLASWVTGIVQCGRLRIYVTTTLLFTVAVAGAPIVRAVSTEAWPADLGWRVHELAVIGLAILGAVVTTVMRSRLSALAVLGLVGTCLALVFVLFSAPDLALTQIMVEVLMVVLLVMVLFRLPRMVSRSSLNARLRDAVVATLVGVMMTLFVLAAAGVARDGSLSRRFLADSVPEAHGRNVVNVILVDFRAMDTLGEITVLVIAGLGVASLMRRWRRDDGESQS